MTVYSGSSKGLDSQKLPKWSTCWITKCGSSRLRRKTQKHSECEAPRLWPKKEEQTREIACFAVLKRGSSQLGIRRKKILDKSSMKKEPPNPENHSGPQRTSRFWESHTTWDTRSNVYNFPLPVTTKHNFAKPWFSLFMFG